MSNNNKIKDMMEEQKVPQNNKPHRNRSKNEDDDDPSTKPPKPKKLLVIEKDSIKDISEKFKTISSNLVDDKVDDDEHLYNKIRKQLEFYFGDTNLRKDKFLLELVQKNPKGNVDLAIFLNFNKIKQLVNFTNDPKERMSNLVTAVEASQLLKLNKDKTKVRRRVPFKMEKGQNVQKEIDKRTVYVESFPEETTHETLAAIFSQAGTVLHVSLPKYTDSKISKGFAFVEFSSEKEAQEAVNKLDNLIPSELYSEGKGKLSALKVMSKAKWLEFKEEFKRIKNELVKHMTGGNDNGNQIHSDNYIEKDFDIVPGCIVKLRNVPSEIDKQTIKTAVSHFSPPKYVDYKKGANVAFVRFESPVLAKAFLDKYAIKSFELKQKKINMELLQGEEETEYLQKVKSQMNSLRKHYLEIKNSKMNHSFGLEQNAH